MTIFIKDRDYPDFEEHGVPPCAESFPDAFFSDDAFEGSRAGSRGTYTHEREAKLICAECPYKLACLQYALKNPDLPGIWGGSNEYQRRAILRGERVRLSIPPSKG
jgi:WhiB family redox-sensing transcriptional regulator